MIVLEIGERRIPIPDTLHLRPGVYAAVVVVEGPQPCPSCGMLEEELVAVVACARCSVPS